MGKIRLRAAKNPWTVISPEENEYHNAINGNVGNLIFGHSVHRHLTTSTNEVEANRYAENMAEARIINEEYDAFVIPLANALRLSFVTHLEAMTKLIKALKVPVVVVGVGAQTTATHDLDRLSPMADVVTRFVSAVLDHSATIGVRGEFTADYLAGLGFRDVEVIGCPSMFMWGADLPAPRLPEAIDEQSKVTVTVSPYVTEMGPIVTHHLDAYPQLDYIAQDRNTLERMLWGPRRSDAKRTAGTPVYLSHRLFQEERARFFVDPWPWFDHLRTRDVAFGTRIHGTIASVLSGTPAVLLAHDSRTLELARYHELPHHVIHDLAPDTDIRDLYAAADYGPMVTGHAERFATYQDFLRRNGLETVFAPGESTEPFDSRVAATTFPRPVGETAPTPPQLQKRLRWLYDKSTATKKASVAKAPAASAGIAAPSRSGSRSGTSVGERARLAAAAARTAWRSS